MPGQAWRSRAAERLARQAAGRPAGLARAPREERLGQQPHVLAALAQRRQLDRHHVDPVEEILAEAPGGHLAREVAVGGRHEARVDGDRLAPAHPLDAALLQRPQQLRLHRPSAARRSRRGTACRRSPARSLPMRRSVASVKEPRSWPNSSLSISGSGIAAQLIATKGPAARGPSSWMARATSSFPVPLSPLISTLARERATRSMVRNTRAHRLAAPDQRAEARAILELLGQLGDALLEGAVLEQVADLDAERVHLEGLGHVVGGAELHGLDRRGDGLRRGQHDHRRRLAAAGAAPRAARARCGPGITRSSRIRSGRASARRASAASALSAVATSHSPWRSMRSDSRTPASSSTTSTRGTSRGG